MTAAMIAPADAADAAEAPVEHDVAEYMQPGARRLLPERSPNLMKRCTEEVPGVAVCPKISPHGGDS